MSGGEFAAIEARVAAASEGPWTADEFGISDRHGDVIIEADDWIPEASDLAFIAAAREDIPRLLAAVRERDDTIARVREVIDYYEGSSIRPWNALRAALDPQETS